MGIFGTSQPGQARYSGELHNLQLTQSVFGTTAPILFGTRRLAAKLLFYGGFYATPAPSGSGKGIGADKGAQEFEYYADTLAALASGSAGGGCLALLNVWDQQGKLQNQSSTYSYTVPSGGGTVSPIASGAAPIQQDLGVSMAQSYSVTANDYGSGGSRTLTGTQQVPFKKVIGTPAANQYSFNPSTSSYTFSAANAGAVVTISYSSVFSLYYFQSTQAAEVPNLAPYQVSPNNQAYFYRDNGVTRVDTGASLTYGASTAGYTVSSGVYAFTSDLAGVYVYIKYTYTSNDSNLTNASSLNLTFFGGTLGQTPWAYMQSKYPGSAFGYTGLCYVGANPMALGMSAVMPSYNYEIVGLNVFPGGALDAHPCDCMRTLLYDAFLGVGFPAGNVDAWTSCYAYWAAAGYLISFSIDTQTSIADAMAKVIETGNVAAVWSGGLLKLIPYGEQTLVGNGYTYTPATTPVVTLTSDQLLPSGDLERGSSTKEDPIQVTRRGAKDCWNYMQAQYSNRANDYNLDLVNEQNDAFIARYGRRIEAPQNWDWITSNTVAAWALNLRLKRQCYLRNTYKFWLDFRFAYLEPMDIVVLPSGEPVRITSIEEDADGKLAIEAEQFRYGSGTASIYPKQTPSSFQPLLSSADPGSATPVVVQNTSAQSSGILNKLEIAATGQSPNWGGAIVNVSLDGESYKAIGTVMAPSVIGLLSAALASAADPDTTDTLEVDITLAQSGAELVSVTQQQADQFVSLSAIVDAATNLAELISYETATLTAANRYSLTYLRRGVYGSAIGAHAIGAAFVYLGLGYTLLSYQIPQNFVGSYLYLKLQSFNLVGGRLQSLPQVEPFLIPISFIGSTVNETYQPSSYTTENTSVSPGVASVTNPQDAYDQNFATAAAFSATGNGETGELYATYAGFPSVTTTKPTMLCVNVQLALHATTGAFNVRYSLNGGTTWTLLANYQPSNPAPTTAPFTLTASIPAGTNLANLQVQIAIGSEEGSAADTASVFEIWLQ